MVLDMQYSYLYISHLVFRRVSTYQTGEICVWLSLQGGQHVSIWPQIGLEVSEQPSHSSMCSSLALKVIRNDSKAQWQQTCIDLLFYSQIGWNGMHDYYKHDGQEKNSDTKVSWCLQEALSVFWCFYLVNLWLHHKAVLDSRIRIYPSLWEEALHSIMVILLPKLLSMCIYLHKTSPAGLDPADRFQVETKFMNRDIRVIGI